ncbi:MAG: hypothetical protein HOA57_03595 [Candidatus Magasanikbacteria bacterium]|jgi:hypothetical protein|nr:hypothetical protein [Candidatus Magasanikbacteria bacterium]MBT4314557.1 hypothetical protein [Candidatus Magasanikbacteria bacterium]MBT4547455.1 hypothetical protein [Candidatus Magasanikbacteria bacterium]MBT6819437.1 hypothetical protein [Candidatus Magasanikbacteria bacterium]
MLPNQMPIIKKTWSTRTKVLIGLGIAVLLAIFTFLVAFYTTDRTNPIQLIRGAQEPEVEILTTTDEAKPGDIFGVEVKTDEDKEVTSVKFFVDGELEGTCEGEAECSFTSGPFSDDDIGGHKYETELTYSDGTSYKKSGTFSVSEKNGTVEEEAQPEEVETSEPENAPNIEYFYTSNIYLSESELLVASLSVADITKVDYLDIQIDNESKKICSDSAICSLSFIIPKNLNLGKHTITGRAIGVNGLVSYINKNFYIIEETIPEEVYVSPSISISPSKTEAEADETINFSVNVNPGSKTLEKTRINVGLVTVQECNKETCNYTGGGPYPQYAGLSLPYHAIAYFTDNSYISTGLQTVKIKSQAIPNDSGSQPEPEQDEPIDEGDTELPTISVEINKASMFNTDEATVIAKASDNEAVGEIMIFVDGQIVKTCQNVTTCSTTVGPYPNFTENKTIIYGAYAFDSSGNDNWSGYSSIQVNIPDQIIEPTLKLILKKNNFNTDETLIMIADVDPGSKELDYLSIWMGIGDGLTLKPCFGSCTINSGLTNLGGQTIPIIAKAFFTDGTDITTETQTITVNAPEVPEIPAEPTVDLNLNKNSVSEGEGFNMTATVDTADKTITKIQITNNSNTVYKTCNNIVTCYYDASSKPWIVGVHPFRAIATFSDGTIINSGLETINVFAAVEPTITIGFSPNQASVTAGQNCTISSVVDSKGKTISSHKLYGELGEVKNCTTETCSFTSLAYELLGGNSTQDSGIIGYSSKVWFTDGTFQTSILGNIVEVTAEGPVANPTVELTKDVASPVAGDIVNITATVDPSNKTISKVEIKIPNGHILETCYNTLTCTYTATHNTGGLPVIIQSKATFTDNSTASSFTLYYTVGFPAEPIVELTKDKSPVVVGDVVGLTATVDPAGKTISKLEILDSSNGVLNNCPNSLTCTYNQNHSQAGILLIRKARATFTDNSTILSNVLTYFIGVPAEPTIEINKDIGSVVVGDTVNITAIVNPENKTVHKLEIIFPLTGSTYITCPSATTCTHTKNNVSYTGLPVPYQAKATFTDSSTLLSNSISYFVSIPSEPTIDISFSPQKKTLGVTASENCTISSTVNPSNKEISYHRIYTEGILRKTCGSDFEECSYSAPASTMLGYTPSRSSATLDYYSSVVFTDGTSKMVQGNSITVTAD